MKDYAHKDIPARSKYTCNKCLDLGYISGWNSDGEFRILCVCTMGQRWTEKIDSVST